MREKRWVDKSFALSGTNVDYPSQSFGKVLDLEILSKKLHKPFGNQKLCGHFLRIRGNKIYFVHQTARKFLLDSDPTSKHTFGYHLRPFGWKIERPTLVELKLLRENNHLPRNDHSSWKHSTRLDVATRYLLQVCVDYMGMFKSLDQEVYKQQMSAGQYYERHKHSPEWAFLRYSSVHWVEHYRAFRKDLNEHFDYLFDRSHKYFMVELWLTVYFTSLASEEERRRETRVENPANPEESFQRLLDFFSLSGIDTEVYDEEFIEGDQYWKETRNDKRGDRYNDTEDDEFTEDRSELIVPDQVQHFRRIHRNQVQERI